ncbi:MAG: hypothetical protein Q7J98_13115 [Kiritimatiellia bacterium]|nr:hypothetical protein [Kiritimatiellia bacterium]
MITSFQKSLNESVMAKGLPGLPSIYNCRFLYRAQPGDDYAGSYGGYTNTLVFNDEKCPTGQAIRMVEYQRSIGATCFPWVFANPDGRTYPTVNGVYRGEIDKAKLQQWHDRCMACIIQYGVWPIPCGYCCENANEDYATWDTAEIDRIAKAIVPALDLIAPFWCFAWEARKFWNADQCETVAQIYRQYTSKPIVLHDQGWDRATGATIQGLIYEWKHHPKYGMDKTPQDLIDEGINMANHLPGKAFIAGEWIIQTDTEIAARQRAELLKYPIYGAWN